MNRKEKEQKAIEMYVAGKSCTQISQTIHTARKSVYRILKRNNISLRPPERKKCLLCDNQILVEKDKNRNRCGTCNTNIRRYRIKKKAIEYKGGKCEECDWEGDISGYDFHHTDPTKKDFEVTGLVIASMKWEKVQKELDKCVLLCAPCHRFKHSKYNNELFLQIANGED